MRRNVRVVGARWIVTADKNKPGQDAPDKKEISGIEECKSHEQERKTAE